MYQYKINKLPKNTVEIDLTILKNTISQEKEKALFRIQKVIEIEGFRKGKAPLEVVKKNVKEEDVIQEAFRELLPNIYSEIIKKEDLKPIINPKIELIKAKENEDWKLKITLAEKPAINLKSYKEKVKKIKLENKKADIWLPGKDKNEKPNKEDKSNLINKILEVVLQEVDLEISDLIIEEELNHRLTHLIDEIQKLGLTVESYLKSKNTTLEKLKEQYKKEIEDTYKLEFILNEIADKENIQVEKEELEKLFVNLKDEKAKEEAKKNSYYYALILRKQKTLDFLLTL